MEPTRNSILRISDDKTLELIKLYEEEQCLWNTELPSYKNRAKRLAAAERIARKLAIDKFDSRHVAIKFKNLRNSYCQELKKMAYSCSVSDSLPYKPKVFWFPKMDSFLRPHLQPTWDTNTSTPQEEEKQEVTVEESAEELVQLTNPEDVLIDSGSNEEESRVESRKRLRSRKSRQDSDFNSSLSTHLRDDCFDSFGKYVSSMLRTMPKRKAMELQPKIVSLLTSANFEDSENLISQSDVAK